MDFEELKIKLGLPQDEKVTGWHRHRNKQPDGSRVDGGWVQNTAEVSPIAYVDDNVIVTGNVLVAGDARLLDEVLISGSNVQTCIAEKAVISGRARITGGAVTDSAMVTDDVYMSGGLICGDARVGKGVRISSANVDGDMHITEQHQIDELEQNAPEGPGTKSRNTNSQPTSHADVDLSGVDSGLIASLAVAGAALGLAGVLMKKWRKGKEKK